MKRGFTLIEVMIALAVVGGLLVTLLYTVNYNLGIAERHSFQTTAMLLAKEKLLDAEKTLEASKGSFPKPYSSFSYEVSFKDSQFPGVLELSVTVTDGRESVSLVELVLKEK